MITIHATGRAGYTARQRGVRIGSTSKPSLPVNHLDSLYVGILNKLFDPAVYQHCKSRPNDSYYNFYTKDPGRRQFAQIYRPTAQNTMRIIMDPNGSKTIFNVQIDPKKKEAMVVSHEDHKGTNLGIPDDATMNKLKLLILDANIAAKYNRAS